MELNGARVLLTGASRGIGAELARALADAGADLALVARSREPLEKVAADTGGRAYPADLTDRQASGSLVERVEADGPIDVLINNAGVDTTARLTTFPAEEVDALLELNLHVPIQLCRQVLPGMLDRGRGHIVNVSSLAGTFAIPGMSVYTASKAGLSHFTAGVRAEVKGKGVGVTLVEIGPTQTEMMDTLRSYGPAKRSVGRFEALRLSYDLPVQRVVHGAVDAIRHDRRYVRLPRRAAAFPMIVEMPRRIGEVILTGVDHHGD
jgi:short-subunit dehydrogenase